MLISLLVRGKKERTRGREREREGKKEERKKRKIYTRYPFACEQCFGIIKYK